MLGLTQRSNYLTFKGSFSAVSKPYFASKYAVESSRRDLPLQNQPPDLFAAEESKTVENCFCLKIARHVANFLPKFAKFCQNFGRIRRLMNFVTKFKSIGRPCVCKWCL